MFGALAGAGLMAALGLANAYIIVTVLYLASTLLTLFIQSGQRPAPASVARPFAELREGIMLLRDARALRHILYLAFLVNLTVLSITGGLLPLVARDIYGLDSLGLGVMAATFAGGALIGSLLTATLMRRFDPERLMFRCAILWHLLMAMYTQIDSANIGIPMLAVIGLVSSFVMVPMASCLLRRTPIDFRGRIMGLRQACSVRAYH